MDDNLKQLFYDMIETEESFYLTEANKNWTVRGLIETIEAYKDRLGKLIGEI
jgi:hypothetical protein